MESLWPQERRNVGKNAHLPHVKSKGTSDKQSEIDKRIQDVVSNKKLVDKSENGRPFQETQKPSSSKTSDILER